MAQRVRGIPPERPKLVVAIVVDMMRYDYLTRYWGDFEKGGFKRLVQEGTLCKNTNLNYIYTQTGVGHATIFTGATPAVHGIVSNEWYVRNRNTTEYCVDYPDVKEVGGKHQNKKMSPKNLLASTIGDEIKLFNNGKSKVIGISIKDRAAVLSAGRSADAAYWYDDVTGDWMTSSYYMDTLPKWVKKFNKKKLADFYLEKTWDLFLPADQYDESLPDDNEYETGFNRGQKVFPYNLAELTLDDREKRNYKLLKHTPYGNTYTKDFALAAIDNEGLGKDEYTDFLVVSFSCTDYIGHYFGPRSMEIQDTYLRLDQEIKHFVTFLDEQLGKENIMIILTSDHGVADVPAYLQDQKLLGGIFRQNYAMALLKAYLNALYGEGEWISKYLDQQIYLNHELIEDAQIPLEDIQRKCAEFMVQFSGVSHAFTSTDLKNTSFNSGLPRMVQNNYNPLRCGDILLSLNAGYIEDIAMCTTHNSAYSYDTHIPLIWFGWKIRRNVIETPIEVTDIAATLASILNISFPSGCFGKPLNDIVQ